MGSALTQDDVDRTVRLALAEESRKEDGMLACVVNDRRLERLERARYILIGAVAALSFLGSLLGGWIA